MSNSNIMSIAEMIDNAFGEADANIVNFKLIQTVLYLLARQLRILERKVKVEIEIDRGPSRTNLSVTEVKIRATVPKIKKKIIKPGSIGKADEDKKGDNIAIKSSKPKPSSFKEPLPIEKSISEKSSEKTISKSTEKSTLDKSSTTKSFEKSSSEKTKSTEKSSTEKSSTEKSSTNKTSTDKTTSSSLKSASTKDTSNKTPNSESKKKLLNSSLQNLTEYSSQDWHQLLELIEEQREKELRIIHQRADSRDVGERSPTPMASLDSVEEQYEKLLVVERIPVDRTRSSASKREPQLSIVTQNQFEALTDVVRELQNRFKATAMPDFPDNVQLMQELRRGASLTDAMAALQLSARLDAAEKTLKQMLELVTELALKYGMENEIASKEVPDKNAASEILTLSPSRASKKSTTSKLSEQPGKSSVHASVVDSVHVLMQSSESSKPDVMPTPSSIPGTERDKVAIPLDYITYDDLDKAMETVVDGVMNTITGLTTRSNTNAENAIKIAKKLEEKLESSLHLGSRMNDLELLVSEYSDQINILDTSLSSQMTNYQEQLTQMQHDLEAGLEAMAEAFANTGGDTTAVAELNTHFTNLQADVDVANMRQKDLKESQNILSHDLQALWQQIELLRGSKADRDEVSDALRDKAGLGALNGLVSLQQFHAVRGDFEKRIGAAYDKFNNQEITWQKAIDDLLRELNDKADWMQLVALRDDVNKNFEMLRHRTDAMLEIVGEPRAAAITRRLFRDAACLSCSSPAHMDMEERARVPLLPAFPKNSTRPPTIGAEDLSKPAEDGDHKICYPGLPIPHPIDIRSHICQRYCGGSHTLVTDKKGHMPVGLSVTPALRRTATGIGSDGKMYMMEDAEPVKKPCIPCNENNIYTPQPSEAEQVQEDFSSDMTPLDFLQPFHSQEEGKDDYNSMTPPPPTDD